MRKVQEYFYTRSCAQFILPLKREKLLFKKRVENKMSKLLKNTTSYHDELMVSLKNPDEAMVYLRVALDEYQNDNDFQPLLLALRNVAESRGGLSELAKKTNLNRQSLYKTLSKVGNPRLDTLGLILKELGFHLSLELAA